MSTLRQSPQQGMRASGMRWKEICWKFGLARAAAHDHRLLHCVIARQLNGWGGLKHIGRQRLIARVRFGAVSGPPA